MSRSGLVESSGNPAGHRQPEKVSVILRFLLSSMKYRFVIFVITVFDDKSIVAHQMSHRQIHTMREIADSVTNLNISISNIRSLVSSHF